MLPTGVTTTSKGGTVVAKPKLTAAQAAKAKQVADDKYAHIVALTKLPYNVLAELVSKDPMAAAIFQDKQYLQFHKALDKTVLLGPTGQQQADALLHSTASGGFDSFLPTTSSYDNPGGSNLASDIAEESFR